MGRPFMSAKEFKNGRRVTRDAEVMSTHHITGGPVSMVVNDWPAVTTTVIATLLRSSFSPVSFSSTGNREGRICCVFRFVEKIHRRVEFPQSQNVNKPKPKHSTSCMCVVYSLYNSSGDHLSFILALFTYVLNYDNHFKRECENYWG